MTKKEIKRRIKTHMINWGYKNPRPPLWSWDIIAAFIWIDKRRKEVKRLKKLSKKWL
jgi:hypothetical protein